MSTALFNLLVALGEYKMAGEVMAAIYEQQAADKAITVPEEVNDGLTKKQRETYAAKRKEIDAEFQREMKKITRDRILAEADVEKTYNDAAEAIEARRAMRCLDAARAALDAE